MAERPPAKRKRRAAAAVEPAAAPLRDRYGPTQPASGRGRAGARREHIAKRRGDFDAEAQLAALRQRREQVVAQAAAQPARAAALHAPVAPVAPTVANPFLWLPLGPNVVLAGQAGGRPRVAGRVRDVAVSANGRRIYAGTANGGVWYSSDAGESWSPLGGFTVTGNPPTFTAPASVLTCGCLLVVFDTVNDPPRDKVWVGTGELSAGRRGLPGGNNAGVGVLFADDPAGGAAWTTEPGLAGMGTYRLAADPADATSLVAATSAGLFARTTVPAVNWTQVAAAPFAGLGLVCTDVCWVAGQGGVPTRLYVATIDAGGVSTDVWVSNNGLAGPFNPANVPLPAPPPNRAQRMSLASAPSDASVVYVLGNTNTLWRIDYPAPPPLPAADPGPTLTAVQRVPPNLLGGQDDYNQAIGVHPTRPERIILGGATELADGVYSASLYLGNVTRSGANYRFGFTSASANRVADASFIGHGVHADIHAARFVSVAGATQLWIGCDGGVFRSLRGDDDNTLVKHSFIARNYGMAALECGYVAGHPSIDGYLISGTQDNGTIERIGVNLWRVYGQMLGDGGAVAFNPAAPQQIIGQYVQADWGDGGSSGGGFKQPVLRRTGSGSTAAGAEKTENGRAGFYSGLDAVLVPALVPSPPASSRLAVGTHRVWFSPDWGRRWRTLPSLRDPMRIGAGAPPQNTNVDPCVLTGAAPNFVNGRVVALRWASPTRLFALCEREVLMYDFSPGPAATLGLSVANFTLSVQPPVGAEPVQAPAATTSPGQRLPGFGSWSDLAVQDAASGACYVAATGRPATPGMDTLWWFDGVNRWVATNLRNDPNGVVAPAYAVAVDPQDKNTVYVGTAVGVWRGTFNGVGPPWVWTAMCNGLPESAVDDLHIYRSGGVRLLRATMQARGVWEVDLTDPLAKGRSFVRVHAYDMRRESPVALADPKRALPNTGLLWHASPDVRVRPQRAAPPPNPRNLPWSAASSDPYGLWVFQTALHARGAGDPLVKADGQWTKVFEARLFAATASRRVTQAVWNNVVGSGGLFPDAYARPWNNGTPTEADLFELIVDRKVANTSPASMGIGRVLCHVDVQVHHRFADEAPANDLRVALLMQDVGTTNATAAAAAAAAAAWSALPCAWAAGVQAWLRAGVGPAPALIDNWSFADLPGNEMRPVAAVVDARRSRTVSFDIDLTPVARGRRVLLVAVIHSSADPVTLPVGQTLETLVRSCRFVAARSLEIL